MENIEELQTTDNSKCPNCGANLEYSPEKNGLYCSHCDSYIKIESKIINNERLVKDYSANETNYLKSERIFNCQNCGAKSVFTAFETSTICPFCGSSHVMLENEIKGLKPTSIIPFKISKEGVNKIYKHWIKNKYYAPSDMKKDFLLEEIKGVYEPIYTYDSRTISNYRGRLGKYYTRTVGSGKNRRTVTEIRYFTIKGVNQLDFDDVLVNASSKIEQSMIDGIKPFDTNNGVEYKSDYLHNFKAEYYSIDMLSGYEKAKQIMEKNIRTDILCKYHYDVVDYLDVDPYFSDSTFKYMLIPIWFISYKYHNKNYTVLINGETGKINGKYPISVLKVSLTVLIFLMIFIIGIIIYNQYTLI